VSPHVISEVEEAMELEEAMEFEGAMEFEEAMEFEGAIEFDQAMEVGAAMEVEETIEVGSDVWQEDEWTCRKSNIMMDVVNKLPITPTKSAFKMSRLLCVCCS